MSELDAFIDQFAGVTESYFFYNGEIELRYDPKDHVYLLVKDDGTLEPQWGVTSVVHIIDKSNALVPWACKMMALKIFKTAPILEMPDGTRMLGHMDLAGFEKLIIEGKSAHKEKLEEAGDIGHTAHAWIERQIQAAIDAGHGVCSQLKKVDPLPENPKAASCCMAALDWMDKHNVRWRFTERKIYSRKYRYAGTMDGLCIVDSCGGPCCPVPFKDRLTVADWKSSNYLYNEYLLQTAGYQQAFEEETGEDVQDRWVIRLGKEDGEFDPWHLGEEDYPQDFQAFLLTLHLSEIMRAIEDRMDARARAIRAEKKRVKLEERDAANKIKCPKAKDFKGTRYPKCNDGVPCETCLKTYETFQQLKRIAGEAKEAAKTKLKADKAAAALANREAKAAAKAALKGAKQEAKILKPGPLLLSILKHTEYRY